MARLTDISPWATGIVQECMKCIIILCIMIQLVHQIYTHHIYIYIYKYKVQSVISVRNVSS